ncbi:MAG TPA: hypothetical protein VIX20_05105 [Ktedonobacteraceae bacterium]
MDEQTTEQPEKLPELSLYEQLYQKLCAYHFGTIGFLELLDAFEEILHIKRRTDADDAA